MGARALAREEGARPAPAPEAGCPPAERRQGRSEPRSGAGPAARALFTALASLGSLLPLRALRALTRGAAVVLWHASPRLRRGLDRNARRLLGPEPPPARLRALARAQLRGFADFTAEIAAGRPDHLIACVEGAENLSAVLREGRGVVAVTLHFGNYELLAAALAGRIPAGVTVVYDRDPSRAWERRRTRWRRRAGLDQIAIDVSPYFGIEALARLRAGGAVLLAGDQVEAREGERFQLLGAPAPFSTWPARLARSAEAPILPAFAVRVAGGRYRLVLEKPIFPGDRDPLDLTRELVAVYQRFLFRYPEEWLMVRAFWCEDLEPPPPGAPGGPPAAGPAS